MPSSNPAFRDDLYQPASGGQGGFSPSWGSPADELPPGVFGGQAAVDGAAGTLSPTPGTAGTGGPTAPADTMRVGGTVSATTILLAIMLVAGWFGWQSVELGPEIPQPDGTVSQDFSFPAWLMVSWIAGFGLAILTIFKPKLARVTAPLYAAAQGLLVGAISAAYEVEFDGIVLQAIGLTVAVFAIMLVLFASGAIRVTNKLRMAVFVATGAVALVYLVSIVLSFFGSGIPMIHDAGPIGILFSVVVVGIASFNLLLDFDFVQRGIAAGAPRYLEWYSAFSLLLTLIWLYLEILRLLSKLRSN